MLKVTTSEGDTPISEIQIGDYVLAWNEETGEISFQRVTDTLHDTDETIVHLRIDGEEITTTPEHPFYVEGKGWVNAGDLQAGDEIRNADESSGEVEKIEIEQSTQEMYNLTVDEAHTFYVGDGQWLVHNTCPINKQLIAELEQAGASVDKVIRVTRRGDGKLVWLEEGNSASGLKHITSRHGNDFNSRGIPEGQIPDALMTALDRGKIIGQIKDGSIYQFIFGNKTQNILMVVGDNGYIVTAYPVTP